MSELDSRRSPISFDDLPSDVREAAERWAHASLQVEMALREFRDVVANCVATQEQIAAMYWIFSDAIPSDILAAKLDAGYASGGAAALAGAWGQVFDRRCECGRSVYVRSRSDRAQCECGRYQ